MSSDHYAREVLQLEKFLRAYLYRFAPNTADIDDLLQETYAHLFRLTPEERAGIANVQGFAVRSARNVAMDWLRHRRVVSMESIEELTDLPVIEDEQRLVEITYAHQQLMKVGRQIANLPERCRHIFTLRRVYGLTQKEIAQYLGITEGTVEQQLAKGMRECIKRLREEDGEEAPEHGRPKKPWFKDVSRIVRKRGDE